MATESKVSARGENKGVVANGDNHGHLKAKQKDDELNSVPPGSDPRQMRTKEAKAAPSLGFISCYPF